MSYLQTEPYLQGPFRYRHRIQIIDRAKHLLKDVDYSIIAVTGVSGLLMGTLLAHMLGKKLVVIRKPNDKNNHSAYSIEGHIPTDDDRYIIVDDLIASGATVTRIREQLREASRKRTHGNSDNVVCVGVLCYEQGEYDCEADTYTPVRFTPR